MGLAKDKTNVTLQKGKSITDVFSELCEFF